MLGLVPFSSTSAIPLGDILLSVDVILLEQQEEGLVASESFGDTGQLVVIPVRIEDGLSSLLVLSINGLVDTCALSANE